jgi:hypothetical protein
MKQLLQTPVKHPAQYLQMRQATASLAHPPCTAQLQLRADSYSGNKRGNPRVQLDLLKDLIDNYYTP